jgi:hypothetical protein
MLSDMETPHTHPHEDTVRSVHQPAMDIMPPKVAEAPQQSSESSVKPTHAAVKTHVTHQAKQPTQGLGLVVFATIIIVLGLGVLIVYAYLRTKGISIL